MLSLNPILRLPGETFDHLMYAAKSCMISKMLESVAVRPFTMLYRATFHVKRHQPWLAVWSNRNS